LHARFDKLGKRLPDTGHGCGCQMCADTNAPRYERRAEPRSTRAGLWGRVRRGFIRL